MQTRLKPSYDARRGRFIVLSDTGGMRDERLSQRVRTVRPRENSVRSRPSSGFMQCVARAETCWDECPSADAALGLPFVQSASSVATIILPTVARDRPAPHVADHPVAAASCRDASRRGGLTGVMRRRFNRKRPASLGRSAAACKTSVLLCHDPWLGNSCNPRNSSALLRCFHRLLCLPPGARVAMIC